MTDLQKDLREAFANYFNCSPDDIKPVALEELVSKVLKTSWKKHIKDIFKDFDK